MRLYQVYQISLIEVVHCVKSNKSNKSNRCLRYYSCVRQVWAKAAHCFRITFVSSIFFRCFIQGRGAFIIPRMRLPCPYILATWGHKREADWGVSKFQEFQVCCTYIKYIWVAATHCFKSIKSIKCNRVSRVSTVSTVSTVSGVSSKFEPRLLTVSRVTGVSDTLSQGCSLFQEFQEFQEFQVFHMWLLCLSDDSPVLQGWDFWNDSLVSPGRKEGSKPSHDRFPCL